VDAMSQKFIPNGDPDFVAMAESFARNVTREPARFEMTQDDAERLDAAVKKFRAALVARQGGRISAEGKDIARAEPERIIRRLGHLVRSNLRLDEATKIMLGIHPRAEKAKALAMPDEAPTLLFMRALHDRGAVPMHELKFRSKQWTTTKP